MDQPKKTISVGMHYATMIALIVSNLCTLGLAMLFSAAYGQGIGFATWQIENGGLKAHAATLPGKATRSSIDGTGTPPNAPTYLRGTILADPAAVALTWDDNSSNESNFYIERGSSPAATSTPTSTVAFIEIGRTGANETAHGFYYDGGPFTEYTKYWYRVRAANAGGFSEYTNITTFSFSDLTPPLVPQNVHITQATCSDFAFAWDASIDNPGGSGMWGYKIYKDGEHSSNQYNSTVYNSPLGFYAFSTHTFAVAAFDAQYNVSKPSGRLTIDRPLNCPPIAPRNPVISHIQSNSLVLSWDDYSNNETMFYIERRDNPASSYVVVGTVAAGVITFNDTELDNNHEYCYIVRAWNQYGYSGYSQEGCATTLSFGTKP